MHYRRWRKTGDPGAGTPPQRTRQEGPCNAQDCEEPKKIKGFCNKHYQRFLKNGDADRTSQIRNDNVKRFWSYVDTSGGHDACWPWHTAAKNGYGSIYVNGRTKSNVLAHRFAYELLVGPIPDGLVIDHTCHKPDECNLGNECPHRRCCNPRHLEPVSTAENNHRGNTWSGRNLRKTQCPQGHPYDEENTRRLGSYRVCRECARTRTLAHYHQTKNPKG